ncbi:MAG: serine hydrolase domain-containing protein [Acidobacteriota bacterium]
MRCRVFRSRLSALALAGLVLGCSDAPPEGGIDAATPVIFERAVLDGFDGEIRRALEHYRVPGAAVAVVFEDHLVYSRGFGRRGSSDLPLGEETLFRLGTPSRTLASSVLASLADEQRLDWLAPLDGLPAALERGLGELTAGPWAELAGDSMDGSEEQLPPSPGSLLHTLAAATLAGEHLHGDRGDDAYSSIVAALLGSTAEGGDAPRAFRLALQERLIGPAGMVRTVVADQLPALVEDFAAPHVLSLDGGVVAIDYPPPSGVAAAGIATTAADLGRFLTLHLEEGIAQSGKRVASERNLGFTRSPVLEAPAPDGAAPLAERCCGVGAGWRTAELGDGARWVGAEGGVDGYASLLGLVPGRGLGLVVLANLDAAHGGRDFAREVRDAFLARILGRAGTVSHRLDHDRFLASLEKLSADLSAVPRTALRDHFGDYEGGWSLERRQGETVLRRDLQELRLRSSGGQMVLIDGAHLGTRVLADRLDGRARLRLVTPLGERRTFLQLAP